MPNGGSDNCWCCPFLDGPEQPRDHEYLREGSGHFLCKIRNTTITNVLWTYCKNLGSKSYIPDGPIFIGGIDGDYSRIPFTDNKRPEMGVSIQCQICERPNARGILVEYKGQSQGFCCDKHYVQWWKKEHPNIELYYDICK